MAHIFVRIIAAPGQPHDERPFDSLVEADEWAREQFYGRDDVRMATVYEGKQPRHQYSRGPCPPFLFPPDAI